MVIENDILKQEYKNGIIYCYFKKNTIDIDIAKEMVKIRLEHFGDKNYPVILFDEDIKTITKEARDYFNTDEASKGISASAIVLKNPLGKILANFIFGLKKPKVPVKFFNDVKEAEKWLENYKT
jgi:hypothetical protein